MINTSKFFIIIILVALTNIAYSSDIVQVVTDGLEDLRRMQSAGLDLIPQAPNGLVQVVVYDASDYRKLDSLGLNYYISLRNAEDYFARRLRESGARRDLMGGFRTYSEIVQALNRFHEDYSDIVSEPFSIGNSIENRPLWMVRVSDNPDEDEDEPEALYTGLIHCREPITAEILLAFIDTLARGYGRNEYLTYLVDERQLYFLPCHNPDGYVYNEQNNPNGGGMWRKNRRNNGDGSYGVDLNRNFGYQWGFDDVGSSGSTRDETYRGRAAFSEPETDAVRDFVNQHRISTSLYFHSYSNLCFYPFAYNYLRPADQSALNAIARRMTALNRYWIGTPWEVIYLVNGSSDDWLYAANEHNPVFSFTIEVGTTNDNFWPPVNRIQPLVQENILPCLVIAEFADQPQRALRPNPPFNLNANGIENEVYIRWENEDDRFNPAQFYQVRAQIPTQPFFDDCEQENPRWVRVNFNLSQADAHSGRSSYRAAINQIIATMELSEEIPLPDTIYAWININLRSNYGHGLACEVSDDGFSWQPLSGLNTRNLIMNNQNLGPVMTGNSNGWQNVWWRTGNRAGDMMRLRFRHYQFGNRSNTEFCYIDDIGPLPNYSYQEIVGETEELEFVDRLRGFDVQYCVQAVDAEGDRSFWTSPVRLNLQEPDFRIRLNAGWTLISAPIVPQSPQVSRIFAFLAQRNLLFILKDGLGRVYCPPWNFDHLGEWNPLSGYYIRLTDSTEVNFYGELIEASTPIPLPISWNLVAYLPTEPMSPEEAFASVVENLILAKDGFGRFWLVNEDFNNMGDLSVGNGYHLKIYPPDTLIYPIGEQRQLVSVSNPSRYVFPDGFVPPSPDNASVLLKFNRTLPLGCAVVVYDDDGLISGIAKVSEDGNRVGIAVWGEVENNGAGLKDGEIYKAVLCASETLEIPLSLTLLKGEAVYHKDGISVFSASVDDELLPFSSKLVRAYPNPFNHRITFIVNTIGLAAVEIKIYDAAGRLVWVRNFQDLPNEDLRVSWDAEFQPAGVYLLQVVLQGEEGVRYAREKLLLLR